MNYASMRNKTFQACTGGMCQLFVLGCGGRAPRVVFRNRSAVILLYLQLRICLYQGIVRVLYGVKREFKMSVLWAVG
jgi:hypothetical protein